MADCWNCKNYLYIENIVTSKTEKNVSGGPVRYRRDIEKCLAGVPNDKKPNNCKHQIPIWTSEEIEQRVLAGDNRKISISQSTTA